MQPVDKLSKERPLSSIFNLYVVLSILFQFAIHVVAFLYLTDLCDQFSPYVFSSFYFAPAGLLANSFFSRHFSSRSADPVDLERKFSPSLLNTTIYLISLSRAPRPSSLPFRCTGPLTAPPLHHQNKSRPLRSTSKAVRSARASRRTRRCTTACSVSRPSRSRARPTLCQSSTGGCSWLRWTRL